MSGTHEQRKEGLKEHSDIIREQTQRQPGEEQREGQQTEIPVVGKIKTVGVTKEPVETLYGQFVGIHRIHDKQSLDKMHLVQKLERQEEETMKEAGLYRTIFVENEQELQKAIEKLNNSKSQLRHELNMLKQIYDDNQAIFKKSRNNLENALTRLDDEVKTVNDIIENNRQALKMTTDKLNESALKLRNEYNRIKAEELRQAADLLENKATQLETCAVQTKTEVITGHDEGKQHEHHQQIPKEQHSQPQQHQHHQQSQETKQHDPSSSSSSQSKGHEQHNVRI